MATGFASKAARKAAIRPELDEGPKPYLLTVTQYLTMIEAGVFKKGPRVELLGGVLYEKMTKYPPHNFGVSKMADRLRELLPPGWCCREEKSVELGDASRPEPDVAVLRGTLDYYRCNDPQPQRVGLIVEVSDSSYTEDRGEKYFRYAAAKIPVYVILSIGERRLELYRKPYGRGPTAKYRESHIFDESAEMPVIIEGVELGRIAARDVLA